ncbi:MAG TPA: trehalase family glycosidase, partial [bacterium]
NVLGLPYPYTVPSHNNPTMQIHFYWDTYFTNVGLLKHGLLDLAKSNVDNLLFEVEKYGFIPNWNRTFFLNRSQQPYLSLMVRDIFEATHDKNWLRLAFATLKKEYAFWMEKRTTPLGLNRHYHHSTDDDLFEFYEDVKNRINFSPKNQEEILQGSGNFVAEAETGWDFTPRFENRCADFISVDLNSLLYLFEINAAHFGEALDHDGKDLWLERAEERRLLLNQYCWDQERGMFFDYDFINKKHSRIASLSTFSPLWTKLATKQQAKSIVDNLHRFEYDYGVAACENSNQKIIYQWDYPNGWPPLFYITIVGLLSYDFMDEAKRIAEKYLRVVIKNFIATGSLWEKYNVVDGSINVKNEYEMPAMLGWTAGVFIACAELISSENFR